MDQLQLEFPSDTKTKYKVRVFKDYKPTEVCTLPKVRASAESTRRSLVGLLKRSPYSLDWEEYPRSTGWYGIKNDSVQSIVYQLIIETHEESSNE
jgi:hypothetical protein